VYLNGILVHMVIMRMQRSCPLPICIDPTDQMFYNKISGPFAKFVDSPNYSESELRGGAVTVSLSKYLPLQVMNFL
jgi:hypothetical protein